MSDPFTNFILNTVEGFLNLSQQTPNVGGIHSLVNTMAGAPNQTNSNPTADANPSSTNSNPPANAATVGPGIQSLLNLSQQTPNVDGIHSLVQSIAGRTNQQPGIGSPSRVETVIPNPPPTAPTSNQDSNGHGDDSDDALSISFARQYGSSSSRCGSGNNASSQGDDSITTPVVDGNCENQTTVRTPNKDEICTVPPAVKDNLENRAQVQFPDGDVRYRLEGKEDQIGWCLLKYGRNGGKRFTTLYKTCLGVFQCPVEGCEFVQRPRLPKKPETRAHLRGPPR